ncbi:unnamed protein product [Calypogeia fissa]
MNANSLVGANTEIDVGTTILVPIDSSRPNYTDVVFPAFAPVAGPMSGSGGGRGESVAGVYVALVVWFLIAMAF